MEYLVYLVPGLLILGYYLLGRRRLHNVSVETHKEAVEAGLTEPVSLPPLPVPLPAALPDGPALLPVAHTVALLEPLLHADCSALTLPHAPDAVKHAEALPVALKGAVGLPLELPRFPLLVPLRVISMLRLAAPLHDAAADLLALLQGVGELLAERERREDSESALELLGGAVPLLQKEATADPVPPHTLPLAVPVAHCEGGALAEGVAEDEGELIPLAEAEAHPVCVAEPLLATESVTLALAVRVTEAQELTELHALGLAAPTLAVAAAPLPVPRALPVLDAVADPPVEDAVGQLLPVRVADGVPVLQPHALVEGRGEAVLVADTALL